MVFFMYLVTYGRAFKFLSFMLLEDAVVSFLDCFMAKKIEWKFPLVSHIFGDP